MTGIIFDIDGTIWDSSEKLADIYNSIVRKNLGREDILITGNDIKKNLGKTIDDFFAGVFPMLSEDEKIVVVEHCLNCTNEALAKNPAPMFDGAAETIRSLSEDYPIYIVSNCAVGYIEALLEGTGLAPYVTDHLSNGATEKSKGENIRILMEKNQLDKAVYIGDTQGDYEACLHAQIPFIWAKYGFGNVPDAKYTIESIRELLDFPFSSII
ncbi:MAG: HAD family hydrolase [Eubacteriales bacterium]|nr:HAD family hydrolase [Eubacteriales bacterium]